MSHNTNAETRRKFESDFRIARAAAIRAARGARDAKLAADVALGRLLDRFPDFVGIDGGADGLRRLASDYAEKVASELQSRERHDEDATAIALTSDEPTAEETLIGAERETPAPGVMGRAEALFAERFGFPWRDLVVERLTTAIRKRAKATSWRTALVTHVDKFGLRYRALVVAQRPLDPETMPLMRPMSDERMRDIGLDPTRYDRERMMVLPLPRWRPGTAVRRRGKPTRAITGSHFLDAEDFALIALLLGRVRLARGRTSFETTLRAEAANMQKTITRNGKRVVRGPNGRVYPSK